MVTVRRVGAEEEMFLVDPKSYRVLPVSRGTMRADERIDDEREELEQELFLQQIEINTEPTTDLTELRAHLVAGRERASKAATAEGAAVLAVPTSLFADAVAGNVTPKPRFKEMLELYGEVGRRGVVCGMHVHVQIDGDEEGVRVLDRIQPWLPALVALSANSPFNDGVDTTYACWREQVWDGWPSAGPVEPFRDAAGYHEAVRRLVGSGAVIDKAMVYFDARLAELHPTVEIRTSDVCTDVNDAIVIAALTRALVETSATTTELETPWRIEMLRAGRFLARRYGLIGSLLDPRTAEPRPAREVVGALLDHVKEALHAAGDDEVVRDGVERLLRDGGGAGRQRAVAGDDLDLDAVGKDLLRRTHSA
ncbi:carboxylate-amine ligase [Aeromicrobium sp.]|uniref:carboxylate-amine ligase n=1 Tax=Aeromicrobium sp. TaxID=1871063 RepID=UPI003D6AB8A5